LSAGLPGCDFEADGASPGASFLWSPSVDFKGQIENAGHFWHPATMAMGQIVMVRLLGGAHGPAYAQRGPAQSGLACPCGMMAA
jgi:hypothetical protein